MQPTPLSTKYRIRIQYARDIFPEVSVITPALIKRSEQDKIPHTYPNGHLCLYLPWAKEWTQNMLISETIVPWTSLWLYYYEIWHATGGWLGGGEHPLESKDASDQ